MDVTLGTLFIAGLRQDTREYVEVNMAEKDTSEKILDLAIKSEAARGHGAKAAALKLASIDDIQTPVDPESEKLKAVNEELAALKTRMNTFTAGGKGRGKITTPLPPFNERKTWFYCYKCKQHGLHISKECKLSKDAISKLTPAPRYPNPTSTPSDSQFPNGL